MKGGTEREREREGGVGGGGVEIDQHSRIDTHEEKNGDFYLKYYSGTMTIWAAIHIMFLDLHGIPIKSQRKVVLNIKHLLAIIHF